MDRQTANRELVKILTDLVEKNPELRFGQILRGWKFVQGKVQKDFHFWTDEWYLEPGDVLERVQKMVKELEPQVTITASQFWEVATAVGVETTGDPAYDAREEVTLGELARKLGLEK